MLYFIYIYIYRQATHNLFVFLRFIMCAIKGIIFITKYAIMVGSSVLYEYNFLYTL